MPLSPSKGFAPQGGRAAAARAHSFGLSSWFVAAEEGCPSFSARAPAGPMASLALFASINRSAQAPVDRVKGRPPSG
jgi:hypothetical protein